MLSSLLSSPVIATLLISLVLPLAWKGASALFDKGEAEVDAKIDTAPFFVKHPGFKNATEWALHTMKLAVQAVGQVVVDDAKASGSFDAATQAKAKADAISTFKSMASREALEQLAVEFGMSADQAHQLDGVLGHLVESTVATQKAADITAAGAAAGQKAGAAAAENAGAGAQAAA